MTGFTVQRMLGLLLSMFSTTMLPPLFVALLFEDGTWSVFAGSLLIILGAGVALWWPARRAHRELRIRDGFLIVALFWIVLGLFGSAPLLLTQAPDIGFTNAVFESVSGLTTTGATVLSSIDTLPPSILYYRQQLQWFGGLGIIVLAVAVLPMLGVGGMQLYRAETPGPLKDAKLTPKITQTAKALWYVYLGITAVCSLAYWQAGMSAFDAICHSFSTVAIGGFSTHDASLGYFESPVIESVAIVFMIISGANFALHFLAWRSRSLASYVTDPEFRAYLLILGALSVMAFGALWWTAYYSGLSDTLAKAVFHVVSIGTTTGFTTDSFSAWPGGLPMREIKRLIHPSAEIPVKLGDKAVDSRVVDSVWGFFAIYVVVMAVLILVFMASGMDSASAFAAVAATLNNLGPGLGDVATGFSDVSTVAKWASVCAMLLGRLEIFTLLVLVTPTFWRR
jgi:trk system potassium uptake protein TrkH